MVPGIRDAQGTGVRNPCSHGADIVIGEKENECIHSKLPGGRCYGKQTQQVRRGGGWLMTLSHQGVRDRNAKQVP
jgi:hypothetical protein